jgi:hypothetical protein
MFTPDLDLKVVTRCTKFSIQDKTGVDTGDGTKWSGVAGLSPATLTSAIIQIITPGGVASEEYDILSQIPTPAVTGSWWFNDLTGTSEDGLHNIVYKLKTTDFAITAFANYGSTIVGTVLVTAAAHALVTGMYVDITGSTSYNGEHYVTRLSASQFYFTGTWVADDGSCTGTREYKSTFYPYVYCIAEAGVDKMYANLARMVPGETRKKYQDDANTAWALLQSLKSAISSSNISALTAIQAEIYQILDYNDVDPNL